MFKDDRIPKLVLLQGELDRRLMRSDLKSCYECNSNLMYVEEIYGIVREKFDYKIMGDRSDTTYQLRVVQINLICAECGAWIEDYFKVYSKDEVVYYFDNDLDEDEKTEVEYCLHQFNQSGNFEPRYKFAELNSIKEKLLENEKLHPDLGGQQPGQQPLPHQ